MTVSQISVFANSRPGHMNRVLDLFEGAGVSVRGFSAADTGEYGILRFIVDKPEAAMEALKGAGCACVVSPVICLKLVDDARRALAGSWACSPSAASTWSTAIP